MSIKELPFSKSQLEEISSRFPTPFHIYDEKAIRENARELNKAFAWNEGFKEYFAVKATPNPFLMKILKSEDFGTDCSSLPELLLSEKVGIVGTEIMFSSNDTPAYEFQKARQLNAVINLDDISHIQFLEKNGGIPEIISVRYNPGKQREGSFIMGSHLSLEEVARRYGGGANWHANWYKDEQPPHPVEITRPFYLQTTEVSQAQWKRIMGNNPSRFEDCGDDCPVEKVSWNDAQKFIEELNQMEGINKYRLPTEAEWEYACRAKTETAYSFGDEVDKLGEYARYGDNSGGKTKPVGKKKPNAWGLYDMHGNVWEWVQDRYGDYPTGPIPDPKGPDKGEYRV